MPPELILKLLAETPLTDIAELRHKAIALIRALQARVEELEAETKKYLTTIGEMAIAHVAAMDKRDALATRVAELESKFADCRKRYSDLDHVRANYAVELAAARAQEPNFCELCAMDLSTCDCVTPCPVYLDQTPVKAWPSDQDIETNRLRNVIQSACIGGTDAMLARWIELFPNAPVPTVSYKPVPPVREPLSESMIQHLWDIACQDSPQNPGWCRHIRFARAIEAAIKEQP